MPIGIERINARRVQPNSRIVFIKPLPGPTEAFAQDFLERVAAICHPIMKANHLSVMSLEEYEPNPEFIGRNFNAGEVIQLVLKAPYTGHWMSFRSVVMVMMHELAHCNEMNHSRAFWAKRNQYAMEMKGLWQKGYSGDGFWSRGKTLLSGQYEPIRSTDTEVLPRHLCGGTFRSSRGKKRKRKAGKSEGKNKLSYAERQQRRIARKFGTKGVTLGDDEDTRVKLEDGKKPKGKPRVAGSTRGRELRAAAAIARFGQQAEEVSVKDEESLESGSETESDYDGPTPKGEPATDLNGIKLVDSKGNGMIKVCENEDEDDIHVREEMEELYGIDKYPSRSRTPPKSIKEEDNVSTASEDSLLNIGQRARKAPQVIESMSKSSKNISVRNADSTADDMNHDTNTLCPICTMANQPSTTVCIACSHVLDPSQMSGHWRCQSDTCKLSSYINPVDYGLCGVCGSRRSPGYG